MVNLQWSLATPKIKAEEMLHQNKTVETPFWQRAVDGALLYLAPLAYLVSLPCLNSNLKTQNGYFDFCQCRYLDRCLHD